MGTISYEISLFTAILSGAFMFTALYLIKKSVGNNSKVNIEAMTMHATSFGLYMASVLVSILFHAMYHFGNKIVTPKTYRICLGITYLIGSLSQVVLCMIFWDLGKKQAPRQARKKHEQVERVASD